MTSTIEKSARRARTGAGVRLNADHIGVYRVIVVLVIGSGLAGMIMSWSALLRAATYFELPSALAWVLPVAVDMPIATLALASLAQRSRGRDDLARLMTGLALIFTAIVAALCFVSVADANGLLVPTDWVGACGKALAPGITLVMTEVLGMLVMRPKRPVVAKKRRARSKAKTAAVQPIARVEEVTDAA